MNQALLWTGWVLTGLVGLLMAFAGVMGISPPPEAAEQAAKYGYPDGVMFSIGVTALVCALLYVIPQTAALGAVLLTGYMGGAIATHVSAGEEFAPAAVVGVVVWLALYLRDPRVRELLPLRRPLAPAEPTNAQGDNPR